MRTYEEIVEAILEIPKFTKKNNPEHTRELLQRLGNPQEKFQVIHVAGSNGKGSVCACIDSVLRQAGKKTGMFTSPHLVHMEERFALEGKPCDRSLFVKAAEQVAKEADEMVRKGFPYPTFFEYIFAMGMIIFAEQQVEYAVLETGLGGRLDATNVVRKPVLTVITSISLEHTEILGDTISEIAIEKAGILKAHVPAVYDASLPEVQEVMENFASSLCCPLYPVFPEDIKILLNNGKKIAFSYKSGYDVTELEIPFAAPYQAANAALALRAVQCLMEMDDIPQKAVRQGFAQVKWKGRMQQISSEVYFDGAHNLDGIEKFLEAALLVSKKPAILLFSMVREKDYLHAADLLLAVGKWEEIILTTVPGMRGMDAGSLREIFEKKATERDDAVRLTGIKEVEAAYAYALSIKKPGQVLFCAGSLYLIGELERIAGGIL